MVQGKGMQIKIVQKGSKEWLDARELRYTTFYKDFDLPRTVMDDSLEDTSVHIVALEQGEIAGSARLSNNGQGVFTITQMAVDPSFRRMGIGSAIVTALIDIARKQDASSIELSARITATKFYLSLGFKEIGGIFSSEITGLPHINMVLTI